MSLHDELERIADAAPPIRVDPDTWGRARAARRRDGGLVAAGAAALAAVAVLAVALVPRAVPEPAPAAGVLPTRIGYVDPEPLPDLAGGAAAAAYLTRSGAVVLVGGSRPAARALELPDLAGPVALSPDGTRLAYAYLDPDTPTARGAASSGLAVVDLGRGLVTRRAVALHRTSVRVATLVWSDSGRSLGYVGTVVGSVAGNGETTTGRFTDDAARSFQAANPTGSPFVGLVSGVGVAVVTDDLVSVDSVFRTGTQRLVPEHTSPVADDGELLGLCTSPFRFATLLRDDRGEMTVQPYTYDGSALTAQHLGRVAELATGTVTVLGCSTPDGRLLADGRADLVLATSDTVGVLHVGADPSYDVVARLRPGLTGLTVAADLVTP